MLEVRLLAEMKSIVQPAMETDSWGRPEEGLLERGTQAARFISFKNLPEWRDMVRTTAHK